MQKLTALFIDKSGNNSIFEKFASEFEQAKTEKDAIEGLESKALKIEFIERQLQDLSEKIDARNEHEETVFSLAINRTREILSQWFILFKNRNIHKGIIILMDRDLDSVIEYIAVQNISKKSIGQVETYFNSAFIVNAPAGAPLLELINQLIDLEEGNISYGNETLANKVQNVLDAVYPSFNISPKSVNVVNFHLPKLYKDQDSLIEDGEDVLYKWDVRIWIDTNNAGEANKLMNLISSTLLYVDDVEIQITDAGVGSFWQNWLMKFRGWASKEETIEVVEKAIKTAEAIALDKHLEPIEKSKIERKKIEEDLKRLMPEEQVEEMQQIAIETAREELKAKKLANFEKQLQLRQKLSEMLAQGLVEIDSDFKIEINGLLLIEQKNKNIILGASVREIDEKTMKEKMESPEDSGYKAAE